MRPWQPLALKSLKIIGDLTLSPRTFWRFNFSSGKQVAKSKNITLIWINMPSRPKCSWVNVWPWRPASSSGSESPAMELVSSFTEEKGVRGLFHAWNLLKSLEVDIYLYVHLCIFMHSYKTIQKQGWWGQRNYDRARQGIQTLSSPELLMLRLSMQVWSAVRTNDLDVQSILRAVEAAVATLASLQTERSSPLLGEHVFLTVFSFSQKLCRVLYMSYVVNAPAPMVWP